MKKIITEGLAGLCILAVLPSCKTTRQDTQSTGRMERVQSAAVEKVPSTVALVRRAEIPLLQIDALAVYSGMISYLTPEAETCPAEQLGTEKLTAYIGFPAGSVKLDLKYGNNRAELEKLKERLVQLQGTENRVRAVRLTGFASPEVARVRMSGWRVTGPSVLRTICKSYQSCRAMYRSRSTG